MADRARLARMLAEQADLLTSTQLGLWLWEKMEPGNPALVLAVKWRSLKLGVVDFAPIGEALEELTRRHPLLGTCYPRGEDLLPRPQPCSQPLRIRLVEDEPSWNAALEEPFDLERGPLVRVVAWQGQGQRPARLELRLHHILCDWWSMALLVWELAYLSQGHALPPVPLGFPQLARVQALWLKSSRAREMSQQLARELASPRADFRLPTDFARPAGVTMQILPLRLGVEQTQRLNRRAAEHGVGMAAWMLATWGRVLSPRSRHRDITIIVPHAARSRAGWSGVVGPLANLVPVRMSWRDAWSDWLEEVEQALARAQEVQEFPFWTLVEQLKPARPMGAFPFSDVAFSYLRRPRGHYTREVRLGQTDMEEVGEDFLVGPFDLTLHLVEEGQEMAGSIQYNSSLISSATAQSILNEWLEMLGEERKSWPEVKEPTTRVQQEWAGAALRFARKEAFRGVTYERLDVWSERLAGQLQPAPLGKPVGLLARPGPAQVAGWLAILKAGGLCLPLDPDWPEGRLAGVLRDAQCHWLATEGEGLPGFEGHRLALDFPLEGQGPGTVCWGENAYLMYTSGSTGKPRGVLGSQAGLLHRARWVDRAFPWRAGEVQLLRTPVGFVDSVAEWFCALTGGARLVSVPGPGWSDPGGLLEAMVRQKVTRATFLPSLLKILLGRPEEWPDTLRYCFCSGEELRPSEVLLLRERLGYGVRLINLYGATECAGDSTWFDTEWLVPGARQVPLGVPLGESRVLVVDEAGQPCAEGEVGEIALGGPGLSPGYCDEALPVLEWQGLPYWRSGDRGLWYQGQLAYRGRIQGAKIRGWRVDFSEVESVLGMLEEVDDAVVAADEEGLLAWVCGSCPPDCREMWSHLRQILTPAQIPRKVFWLEEFPRSSSGKVDRASLVGRGQELEPARTGGDVPAEWEWLREIFERVLGLPGWGAHDHFFEAGGTSLQAVELIDRVERARGIRLQPGVLLEAPSLALLWPRLALPAQEGLVCLREGEGGCPLILLPGAWGGPMSLLELSRQLSPGRPVWCVDYEALPPAGDLLELVGSCEKALTRRFPHGPYDLCGFSMGGLVAFELAQRFARQGCDLILIDTHGPQVFGQRPRGWIRSKLSETWAHLSLLARTRPGQLWQRWKNRKGRQKQAPSRLFQVALDFVSDPASGTRVFEGNSLLIRFSHQPAWVGEAHGLGWLECLPQLQIRVVQGLHGPLALQAPVVQELAAAIQEFLDREKNATGCS